MKIKVKSLRERSLGRGRAYEKAKLRIISSIWEPKFVIRAKPSLSSDCWGNIAWGQCRPSMGTQPSVNVPWWWWGTAKPLGELLSHCPPFPRASPDTWHCFTAAAPPSIMPPAASSWGSVGHTGLRVTTVLLEAFSHGWVLLASWSTDLSQTLLYLMSSKGSSDSYVPWNLWLVSRSLLRKARFLLNTLGLIVAHVLKMDVIAIWMEKAISHEPSRQVHMDASILKIVAEQ